MNRIFLKGLEVFAYHGVNAEEKRDGQKFVLDITLFADLSKAMESDKLTDTINYAAVRKTVTRAMTESSYDLIERAASVTADALLTEYDKLVHVEVILKKPEAPMSAKFDYVAVEVIKDRQLL